MSLPTSLRSTTPPELEAAINALQGMLGDRLSTAAAVCERHGKDASYHPCMPPDAVAFPNSILEMDVSFVQPAVRGNLQRAMT
jgi:hypothetical protein